MKHNTSSSFGDFKCAHCHVLVSSAHMLSGVNNRNHCPYCLWSRHLDLFAAGDRLSACKAPMKPVGLTMKLGRNKYRREAGGELMLIHQCTECETLSINRIAADDDSSAILAVFEASLKNEIHRLCERQGILALRASDSDVLYRQLYGSRVEFLVPAWS
ncbi:MAG TPA: RNHCP domain-containing protein [Anaerolineales bacterium]